MELTKKQEEGLKLAVARYKAREPYTVIAGYAGTGKSTLVRFIIDALELDNDDVAYVSYTGKAALVLQNKGCPNAMTAHHLLYVHKPRPDGTFYRKPRRPLEHNYKLIIVDEISMLPKTMWVLLLSHHIHVIALGDNFQLPPIDKEEDNHVLDKPHIFLDEIMRQEKDNEIIWVSAKIRQGETLGLMNGENVKIFNKSSLNTGMLTWADQVLVATNAERITRNNQIRTLLKRGPSPEQGDKVICLHNYWDDFILNGEEPLVNGTVGTLDEPIEKKLTIPKFIKGIPDHQLNIIQAGLQTDYGYFDSLKLDKQLIETGNRCCDEKAIYQLNKFKDLCGDIAPKMFAYGYAITTHKAQGGQWNKVLVLEERFPFDKIEHARWLYTAVTRASDKLVLIKN